MTTAVDTDVDLARKIEVRAVFSYLNERDAADNDYPLRIGGAIEHLSGLRDLLYLASASEWDAERNDSGETFSRPDTFIENVIVRRISYASPLEVVVWFFTGTTAATTAVNQLIKLWSNWQFARRTTAESDLYVTAANVLQASIDAPIPMDPSITGYDKFTLAARTLVLLGELEVDEEA